MLQFIGRILYPGKLETSLHCRNSLTVHPLSRSDPRQFLQMGGFKTLLTVLALSSSEVSYLKIPSAHPHNNSLFTASVSLQESRGQINGGSAGLRKGTLHWDCLWFLCAGNPLLFHLWQQQVSVSLCPPKGIVNLSRFTFVKCLRFAVKRPKEI